MLYKYSIPDKVFAIEPRPPAPLTKQGAVIRTAIHHILTDAIVVSPRPWLLIDHFPKGGALQGSPE
jgi:hypothetical protein